MDIITDNIVIILFLVVGAIVQWLKTRGEARQNQDTGYDPADFEEMMQEAQRRQSRPAVPPPLPPTAVPHPAGTVVAPAPALRRKSRELEASPTFDTSSELARQQQLADKLKEMKRTRGARQLNENVMSSKRPAGDQVPATGVSLKARLGNRRELRQAFVLKEILEKPVGLR